MNNLYDELQQKTKQLDSSVKLLRQNGSLYAQAEHDYKIKIAEVVFRMKDDKVPATLINLVVYGDKEVARLRLDRDIKEVTYNANMEAINSLKLQLRLIESQLQREWGNTNGTGN
jgi:chromosome condensin MukBEF MukE localization factor